MESGSYRAETSVVRDVTTTRFYTVVRLDFYRVSGATSRLPRRLPRSAHAGPARGTAPARGTPGQRETQNAKRNTDGAVPPAEGRAA